jgi:hypothetical protein
VQIGRLIFAAILATATIAYFAWKYRKAIDAFDGWHDLAHRIIKTCFAIGLILCLTGCALFSDNAAKRAELKKQIGELATSGITSLVTGNPLPVVGGQSLSSAICSEQRGRHTRSGNGTNSAKREQAPPPPPCQTPRSACLTIHLVNKPRPERRHEWSCENGKAKSEQAFVQRRPWRPPAKSVTHEYCRLDPRTDELVVIETSRADAG